MWWRTQSLHHFLHNFFRYIGLHASPSSTERWTDAQGNVNPVRIPSNENGLTADMVFTAVGNDADGYALKTGNQYLAGRPVDDSPDKWGFMRTDEFSGACFFACNRGYFRI